MHHDLKLFTKYFQAVVDGGKRSEVRYNDRNYQVGDTMTLREGHDSLEGYQYSGRLVSCRISHTDRFGCQSGYLNLSIDNVGLLIIDNK